MNIYEAFEQGQVIDEAKSFPLSETANIMLRPLSGETSKRALEELMKPYSVRLNAGGKLTDEENKKLNAEFYSQNIIKGWSGLKGKKGEDLKFSPAAAEALLLDPKMEKFFALIVKIAADEDQFRAVITEDDAGNS